MSRSSTCSQWGSSTPATESPVLSVKVSRNLESHAPRMLPALALAIMKYLGGALPYERGAAEAGDLAECAPFALWAGMAGRCRKRGPRHVQTYKDHSPLICRWDSVLRQRLDRVAKTAGGSPGVASASSEGDHGRTPAGLPLSVTVTSFPSPASSNTPVAFIRNSFAGTIFTSFSKCILCRTYQEPPAHA